MSGYKAASWWKVQHMNWSWMNYGQKQSFDEYNVDIVHLYYIVTCTARSIVGEYEYNATVDKLTGRIALVTVLSYIVWYCDEVHTIENQISDSSSSQKSM